MMSLLLAKRSAQKIIRDFYIDSISNLDLISIIGHKKILYQERSFEGAEAKFQQVENQGIISINTSITEIGQKRFAIAHELGHFELHKDKKELWQCTKSDFIKFYLSADFEVEANIFASELLMPENMFQKDCEGQIPSIENIALLKDSYQTSLTATAYRYVDIGSHPCALIMSKDGKISWFHSSKDFKHRIHGTKKELCKFSCAGEFLISQNELPSNPEKVDAACWLENYQYGDQEQVFENSIYMSSYDTMLTLIWFE